MKDLVIKLVNVLEELLPDMMCSYMDDKELEHEITLGNEEAEITLKVKRLLNSEEVKKIIGGIKDE